MRPTLLGQRFGRLHCRVRLGQGWSRLRKNISMIIGVKS
jgi:hypothetical protein